MIIAIDFDGTCVTHAYPDLGDDIGAVSMGKPRTTISSIINKRSRRDITDKIDEELLDNHPNKLYNDKHRNK